MKSFTLRLYRSDVGLYPPALVSRLVCTKKGKLSEDRDELSVLLVEGDLALIESGGLRKVTRQIQTVENKIVGVLIQHY